MKLNINTAILNWMIYLYIHTHTCTYTHTQLYWNIHWSLHLYLKSTFYSKSTINIKGIICHVIGGRRSPAHCIQRYANVNVKIKVYVCWVFFTGKDTSQSEVFRAMQTCFCFHSILGAASQSKQDTFVYHSFKFMMQTYLEAGWGEGGIREGEGRRWRGKSKSFT